MSRKEKSTVLYSHNGIKIERVDFIDMTKYTNQQNLNVLIENTVKQLLKKKEDKTEVIAATPAWDEVIKRESKLGFYYYETIHHKKEDAKTIFNDKYGGATFKKFVFKFSNKRFEMQYPISCGDVVVNKETRPWDILPGYTGTNDHFINDLYKEVLKFFEVAEVNRIAYQIKPAEYFGWKQNKEAEYSTDMSWIYEVRKRVFIDLFGDEKGPSINYNDIKILSHGFDLKESFRKRKEK